MGKEKVLCISLFILFCFGVSSCNSSDSKRIGAEELSFNVLLDKKESREFIASPFLELATHHCNFGEVKKEEVLKIVYNIEFANYGEAPLTILKADVSCGCVKVEYPHNPISKAAKATIKVVVDLKNQKGYMNKVVYLKTNAQNDVELIRIKGTVN